MGRNVCVTALAIAALVLAGGCGLRADERPQPIPKERLDPKLFEEGSGTNPGAQSTATIYVLTGQGGDTHLARTTVPVTSGPNPERAALEALLGWTATAPADNQRLMSRIPSGTALRDVRRTGNTVTVDLADFPVAGTGQALAAAQIVWTATENGADAVLFTIDGKPVAVPVGESTSSPGIPVRRRDFLSLGIEPLPPTSSPGTTGTTTVGAPATGAATGNAQSVP